MSGIHDFQISGELFSLYFENEEYSKLIEFAPLLLKVSSDNIQIIMGITKAYLAAVRDEMAGKFVDSGA